MGSRANASPGLSHVSDSLCNSDGNHDVSRQVQMKQQMQQPSQTFVNPNPVVQKDLRLISKFWANDEDDVLEEEADVPLDKSTTMDGSGGFNVVLTKSQKKKLRQKKRQAATAGHAQKALSRAGPKKFT